MRRKDGKPKRRATRAMPRFDYGFRDNPAVQDHLHPAWRGEGSPLHWRIVSLFAGCGGLDLGLTGGFRFLDRSFDRLPFDVVAAIDNARDAVETYHLNLGSEATEADLTAWPVDDIPKADVLAGGFPCQDFSSSGPKVGFSGSRGQLYQVLTRYMEIHRPKLVVAENVPHLARLRGGAYLKAILAEFESAGYRFDVWSLFAPDYGLPQSRRRLFLIGVRDDLPGFPMLPRPTHRGRHVPIAQALADLERVMDESVPNQSQFFVATRATKGGGQGDHVNRPDEVAYCIRANARGRIQFHHHLDRRLTVRECARLQSFPDEFVFPFSTQRNLTLIGNAVPPLLGHHVGTALAAWLTAVRNGMDVPHGRRSASDRLRDPALQTSLLDVLGEESRRSA
jgi:DNA (cytosine-5)-methyltransferase 1